MATIKSCVCPECVAKLSRGLKNIERKVDSVVRGAAVLRGRMEHSLSAVPAHTGDSLPQSPPQPQKKVGAYPYRAAPAKHMGDSLPQSPPQHTYPPPGRLPSPNPKTPVPDRRKTPFVSAAIHRSGSLKPPTARCVRSV
eukprot:3899819-Rhodomonas_salina.1